MDDLFRVAVLFVAVVVFWYILRVHLGRRK